MESAEEFYSNFPEYMDEKFSKDELPEEFLEKRERFADLVEKGRILDAGCGPGRDTEFFMEKGLEAVGVDITREMVEYARENRRGEFSRMDITDLEFGDSSFEGIWCSAAIFFVPREEMEKAMEEFHRVLKDGGVIFLDYKEGNGEQVKEKRGRKTLEYRLGVEEGREMVEEAGFEVVELGTNDPDHIDTVFVNIIARKE